jgi:heme/copper-type cytochrome/quinol oxidase subunit 1
MPMRKSYYWFLVTSILFFVFSFFQSGKNILDINVHDTYYVIANVHLYVLLAVIVFFFFAVYWSLDKGKVKLIAILSKLHIYGTLVSIVGLFFPYSFIFKPSNFPLYDDLQNVNLCISISGLLFLLFQLLFIINIFATVIKCIRAFIARK